MHFYEKIMKSKNPSIYKIIKNNKMLNLRPLTKKVKAFTLKKTLFKKIKDTHKWQSSLVHRSENSVVRISTLRTKYNVYQKSYLEIDNYNLIFIQNIKKP